MPLISVAFSLFSISLKTVDSFQLDFLGLEKSEFLTPEQGRILQLAESLSQRKLQTTFDVQPQHHHRVKRGINPGFVALPLPTLPSDIDPSQSQLLSRPNRRLISLANELSIKRQGVLPPTVNDPVPPGELGGVQDPFLFKPNKQHPNSIQDVLHEMDQEQPHLPNVYPEILTPTTKKPKKKVVYKVVTKKPKVTVKGTTKRTVYKLVTPKPTSVPKVHKSTKKPEIIYHTRQPFVDDVNYDHTRPVPPFPKVTTPTPKISHVPPKSQHPDDYMAVIPYKDVYKLFQMLNKHTKPVKDGQSNKKKRPTRPTLPPPTTKRTPLLQPKVIKRTPLKGKKKKRKKTVHVSFTDFAKDVNQMMGIFFRNAPAVIPESLPSSPSLPST